MDTATFNPVDYVILFILGISIITGMLRGFVREIIGIITWVAAFVVSTMFASKLAGAFTSSEHVQNAMVQATTTFGSGVAAAAPQASMLALGISFGALFIGTLIVGSLVNFFISSAVDTAGVSIVNRLLGAIFGLVRGGLIVLFLVFLIQLTPLGNHALWKASQFVNYFQPAVKWIDEAIQPGLQSLKEKAGQQIKSLNPQKYIGPTQSSELENFNMQNWFNKAKEIFGANREE